MWSFDLSQYDTVWKLLVQIGLLLLFLLIGNILRRTIPFLRKAFIPSALIGGLLFFLTNIFTKNVCGFSIIEARIMQIITYHTLAIGFIAMSFKIVDKGIKKRASTLKVFQNGALTGSTYMLQAIVGIVISLIFMWCGSDIFYFAGVLLPLGFGQGPGNALTWDLNFTEAGLFSGNGSVGLTIASIGFIVASIVGVIYINYYKRKKQIAADSSHHVNTLSDYESKDEVEIEDSESIDKSSIQIALIFLAYASAFGIMFLFSKISDWTGIKLFNDVAWGFNFIWGVIAATIIKKIMRKVQKTKIGHRRYINNYQMDRISGFSFDVMIIAGVAAIDIDVVSQYALFIVIICIVGAIITFLNVKFISRLCFKENEHEIFLVNFGTLTGTASNGMILLREVDPSYMTPTSDIFIISQFPAMLFVAPLLLMLSIGKNSLTGCLIALGIFIVLYIGYLIFLKISSHKADKKPTLEERKEV